MTFNQAMELLSREERFKATVAAMNNLLVRKGIYSSEEFEACFCEWAKAETNKARAASDNTLQLTPKTRSRG